MKKQLAIIGLVGVFASISSFGQGYITFGAGKNTVYDGPNASSGVAGSQVAFLWAATGATDPLTATPTSAATVAGDTWSQILSLVNGGDWTVGVNAATSTEAIGSINASGLAVGGFTYNGSAPFQVAGTSAGLTYELIVIGWTGSYTTLADAAAANANVGISSAFDYALGAAASDPNGTKNFTNSGLTPFGIAVPVPEPTTIALAGLGAISLLALRRKK